MLAFEMMYPNSESQPKNLLKRVLFIVIPFLFTQDCFSQSKATMDVIDKLIMTINSDHSLIKKVEKGRFVGYVSTSNDTTWVPFETLYFFKGSELVKVISTDFRIHDTNTRTIIYYREGRLIKIEEGIVYGRSDQLYGLKAYFVKDTSIYSEIVHSSYINKQRSDSSDVNTAKYYQTKAKNFLKKEEIEN
jgi:hypothetical protein